jgi:translocation and assembly module TamA
LRHGAGSVASACALALAALGLVSTRALAEVTITGIEGPLRDNVAAYLEIDDMDCDTALGSVRRSLAEAPAQVAQAVEAFGYYAARVTTSLEEDPECWHATVRVDPGDPVRWREVDIGITTPPGAGREFDALAQNSLIVSGAPLNHGDYERLKSGLLDLALNRGFAEARIEASRIDIYPEELAADLTLHFDSGPRYAIGDVRVSESGLDPDFVAAYYDLTPGQPYDYRLLTQAFRQLGDSGYFAQVDVRPLPADPATREIPIQIDLTPAPRRLISYGVGLSTDTGPRFRFGRTIRRLNERGHQLDIDAQLSPVVSELTSIYRMPFRDPRYDWLSFSLGAKREETDTSLARSIEAGIRRVVDRARDWSRTQYLSFVVEDFEVGSQSGRPLLLIPGVDWTRIRGDDALRPNNGSRFNVELRAADDALISDTSFTQTDISAKWIHSLSSSNRVLLRGRVGYMVDDQFEKLPPSVRFFAGGDRSIRGFGYKSLGPVDANGAVIGGDRLLELSAEFEHMIKPRWSLAVFADGGNAFNEHGFTMRTGAGFGARWRSPLGPVRIDLAWPVHDRESGARLHVSLGPDL